MIPQEPVMRDVGFKIMRGSEAIAYGRGFWSFDGPIVCEKLRFALGKSRQDLVNALGVEMFNLKIGTQKAFDFAMANECKWFVEEGTGHYILWLWYNPPI